MNTRTGTTVQSLLGVMVSVCLAPFFATAQRAPSISLTPTNDNAVAISWKGKSATPIGDLFIIPEYQLERSGDLRNWETVGNIQSPSLNETVTIIDRAASPVFYRVASIISREYAQFGQAVLDFGQLDGADLFGANLFGASIVDASLRGANLGGADLRAADLSGSDMAG